MKKGFTLIELLIVMVIVGVLVTVALPKYRVAMERGRSAEGIANLRAACDLLNTQYVLNGNSYTPLDKIVKGSKFIAGDFIKPNYFAEPVVEGPLASSVYVRIQRKGSYQLTAYNLNGELQYIECTAPSSAGDICSRLGMEKESDGYYRMR